MADTPPPNSDRRGQHGASPERSRGPWKPVSPEAPTQAAVPIRGDRSGASVDETRDWYPADSPPSWTPPGPSAAPWGIAREQNAVRSSRIRRLGVIGGVVVAVTVASGAAIYAATGERNTIAGTAVTVSATASQSTSTRAQPPRSTPAPAPPPIPMVATEDLEGLLIDDAALSELVGVPLTPGFTPPDATMSVDATDNTQCRGALTIAAAPAYEESRWTAIRRQTSRNLDTKRSIAQAVVNYPSPQLAAAFVDTQSRTWQACDGQMISFDPDTDPLPIRIHSVQVDGAGISAVATSETKGSNCFRELRAIANVVIDIAACNPSTVPASGGADDADRVAAMIADRVAER